MPLAYSADVRLSAVQTMRGVSAGRLAGPYGSIPRERRQRGDTLLFLPHGQGGEHHTIHRVEDLPEVACPHCGRQMKRRSPQITQIPQIKKERPLDQKKKSSVVRIRQAHRTLRKLEGVSVLSAKSAESPLAGASAEGLRYSCACGWGFEVVNTFEWSPPSDTRHCNLRNLLPAWPDATSGKYRNSARGRTWHTDPSPKEVAAREAVLRVFREHARKLSIEAEKQNKVAFAVESRLKWRKAGHRLPWNDVDKEESPCDEA